MADWESAPNAAAESGDAWGAGATATDTNGETNGGTDEWGAGGGDAAAEEPPKPQLNKEEMLAKAKDAGWTETTAFDYAEFQRTGGDSGDWLGAAKVYEWKDDFGDVGPAIPELEEILFGGEFHMKKGEHIDKIQEFTVAIEGPHKVEPIKSFDEAGLHPVVLQNVKLARYNEPTPIQAYCVPAILQGMDVVGISQTGSGKTAAYLVPVISRLMGKAKKLCAPKPATGSLHTVKAEPLVVIVVPTRELAVQIFDEARRMCYRSMLRPCVAYGGLPMGLTVDELQKGCDILIATPGRLCALMDKPHILTMSRVKFTILDEADEMLHSDWEEELSKIMGGGDTNEDPDHVFLMFSATFPKGERKLVNEYMAQDHFRIRVGRPGSAHKNIRQNIIMVDQNMKREAVYDLLFSSDPGRTIIFCNSKPAVDLLDDFLYNRGLPTTSIHSDRNQREREDALRAFRTGRCPILIATGVSARGWDIKDVKHIINYDLPSGMYGGIQEYIHRIGRTARIGHQGLATSFYNDRNEDIAQELVNNLIENECEVPDFLQQYVQEGPLNFDDNSDDEEEGFGEAGGDAGGFDAGGFGATDGGDAAAAGSAWGAPAEGGDAGGFVADGGFKADEGAAAPAGW